ncbi:MAG: hypothetical protein R3250_09010, partial [Melioribacteraceae bacterium]|nr:hypothetical protein [Melioribacteraceae bacterium]
MTAIIRTYLFLLLISVPSFPQSSLDINGYVQNMETVWAPKNQDNWIFSNSIGNRINLIWYANEALTFRSSIRNIFDYGQFPTLVPNYSEIVAKDNGFFDLTEDLYSGKSYVFYTNIDRLSFSYNIENIEIQLGRQRINWGINSVWTPNDIFNSASFLNFDYVEKPGSDALRVQYYFDYASFLELVGKIDYNEKLTMAGRYQLNIWEYDIQLLGGISETDYIGGAGWSGNISGAGFTGELTYFKNRNKNYNDQNILAGSIGFNYMFSNSLFIVGEFLYNSIGQVGKSKTTNNIFDLDYSAKNLSPSRYSIFGQLQYPITPL